MTPEELKAVVSFVDAEVAWQVERAVNAAAFGGTPDYALKRKADAARQKLLALAGAPGGWVEVESSNVARVAYDPSARLLLVEFRTGARFSYAAVPPETYAEFLAAPSQGKFFAARIKDHFTALKVSG